MSEPSSELDFSVDASLVPVCAIGASAGGVNALRTFFRHVRTDLNLAYVVIVHLSPDHPSVLREILAACTSMPVQKVEDGPTLTANCVYVIPPDRELVISGNHIAARPFTQPRGQRAPIDMFFRSIAAARGDGCAMVFTGSGSDGSLGVRAVKEAGGIVFVQEPSEAEYPMMPQNAIATGMADFVAPIRELANNLAEVAKSKESIKSLASDSASNELRRILSYLRARTGHDFSSYKRATVMRRVGRRMQVVRRESLTEYADYVRDTPEEAKELFSDLLISVTMFFRDARTYQTLAEQTLPRIFDEADIESGIRVWAVGSATGEEAYSLAILLLEEAASRKTTLPIQVFATDLDEGALAAAREGRYPRSIEADVNEERLRRWFVLDGSHYRIRQELRDVVLFATHSALKDPPFMRLDLISCRNLLIYLDRSLQRQLATVFHYALKPNRFLFLGSAETMDSASELFAAVDREARIYQSRAHRERILPQLPPFLDNRLAGAPERRRLSSRHDHEIAIQDPRAANEELQSINEELQTVNAELKSKLEHISSAHNDLQNLTSATEIGTLFLDPELRIRMFTPPVVQLFNICDTDVGRALTNFTHQMRYQGMELDARRVLRDLAPFETVIESQDGRSYMMRIRPYRTIEDRIDGLVITFVDVSARLQTERELRVSEERYRTLFDSIDEGFSVIEVIFGAGQQAVDYRFIDVNAAFARQTGLSDVIGKTMRELAPDHEEHWFETYGRVATTRQPERFENRAAALNRFYDVYAFPVGAPEAHEVGILFKDITQRKEAEVHLKLMVNELNHRVKNTLAIVQAIAQQTFKHEASAVDARRRFDARLASLAAAHNLLTRSRWEKALLREVVQVAMNGCSAASEQVSIRGPAVNLSAPEAVSVAMAIHELCSNALKYGALSKEHGRVEIVWELVGDDGRQLRLTWREQDGPAVQPPTHRGFGSMMVEEALAYELNGKVKIDYRSTGVVCTIEARLRMSQAGAC